MEKKQPERHSELYDPKLPVIHAQRIGNRAEQHICPSPINQSDCKSL